MLLNMQTYNEPQEGYLLDEDGFVKIKDEADMAIQILEVMRKKKRNAASVHN